MYEGLAANVLCSDQEEASMPQFPVDPSAGLSPFFCSWTMGGRVAGHLMLQDPGGRKMGLHPGWSLQIPQSGANIVLGTYVNDRS